MTKSRLAGNKNPWHTRKILCDSHRAKAFSLDEGLCPVHMPFEEFKGKDAIRLQACKGIGQESADKIQAIGTTI